MTFWIGGALLRAREYFEHLLTCFQQSLQASVQRVHTYVQSLEEKIDELNKKKK
jgi:hypothetical protein